jgi:rRNA maturation RNase YbeY
MALLRAVSRAARPLARAQLPAARAARALPRATSSAAAAAGASGGTTAVLAASPPYSAPRRAAFPAPPPPLLAPRPTRALLLRLRPAFAARPRHLSTTAAAAKGGSSSGAGAPRTPPPPETDSGADEDDEDDDDVADDDDDDDGDEEFYLDVDVMIAEGTPDAEESLAALAADIEAAAPTLLQAVLDAPQAGTEEGEEALPGPLRALRAAAVGAELSIALCSDAYIQAARTHAHANAHAKRTQMRTNARTCECMRTRADALCVCARAQLNKEWREIDAPTDVLSFPQMDEDEEEAEDGGCGYLMPGGHALLGDVIISVETAARQAAERGHSVEEEIQVLLVHGLLHLLGYDHEEGGAEAAAMAAEEARVLGRMGWGGAGLISAAHSAAAAQEAAEDAAEAAEKAAKARGGGGGAR